MAFHTLNLTQQRNMSGIMSTTSQTKITTSTVAGLPLQEQARAQ